MNEYQMAFGLGASAFCFVGVAYILCYVCQWVWSWVDDGEMSSVNWLCEKTRLTKWKYPVYNAHGDCLRRKRDRGDKPFGYAKDKKNKNKGVSGLIEGKDYVYSFNLSTTCLPFMFSLLALPMAALIAFKLYPVTLFIGTSIAVAYLSRFARRSKKLFDKHVTDKDAHKE